MRQILRRPGRSRDGAPPRRRCDHGAGIRRIAGVREPVSGPHARLRLARSAARDAHPGGDEQLRSARRGRQPAPARRAPQPARARRAVGSTERRPLPRRLDRRRSLVTRAGNADRRRGGGRPARDQHVSGRQPAEAQRAAAAPARRRRGGDRPIGRLPGGAPGAGRPAGRQHLRTGASSTSSSRTSPSRAWRLRTRIQRSSGCGGDPAPLPDRPEAPGGCTTSSGPATRPSSPRCSEEAMRAAARDDEHFRLLKEADIGSAVIVPLRARGEVFGALTLVGSSAPAQVHRRGPAADRGARPTSGDRRRQCAAAARGERGGPDA